MQIHKQRGDFGSMAQFFPRVQPPQLGNKELTKAPIANSNALWLLSTANKMTSGSDRNSTEVYCSAEPLVCRHGMSLLWYAAREKKHTVMSRRK